jgi:hypothetical protein
MVFVESEDVARLLVAEYRDAGLEASLGEWPVR